MMETLPIAFMNAAGECKLLEHVQELAKTPVTDITVGSITMEPRPGNPGETFWEAPEGLYALNSRGLPNPGLPYYEKCLPKMASIAHDAGKRLRVSIAGFSEDEYEKLAYSVFNNLADEVEINLGCPNVWGEGGQKPIASFVPSLVRNVIRRVRYLSERADKISKVSVKFSPFSDPSLISVMANIAVEEGARTVVTSNTFPNGFAYASRVKVGYDSFRNGFARIPRETAITAAEGLAGVSGPAMYPIALGQVVQFRRVLPPHITVCGVGGITSGTHMRAFEKAGAGAVQIGTHSFIYGAKVFTEILQQYADLMESA